MLIIGEVYLFITLWQEKKAQRKDATVYANYRLTKPSWECRQDTKL